MHERLRERLVEAPDGERTSAASHMAPVQLRLSIGRADDPAERDADAIAAHALQQLDRRGDSSLGRQAGRVQRAADPLGGTALDAEQAGAISAALGSSATGSGAVLRDMGSAFGADFGSVRMHTGARVDTAAEGLQASAFTMGRDVFVRSSEYRPGTAVGDELIAHELAHTLQQGAASVNRRTIRRLLIPKALNAFNAAEAANATFATGRTNTDQLASKSDQEDLSRVHGVGYRGGDSPDQEKVAHYVRAFVLTEYAARLRAKETAGWLNDDGTPMTAKQRAAKKAFYKTKADETRKMHIPLVARGSEAPETKSFLAEHGFDAAFKNPAAVAAGPVGLARIDVRSTFIGMKLLGKRLRSHLFIVYTAKDGKQLYFRGGPDENDMTEADMGEYVPGVTDWDPSAHSVTLLEGAAAEAKLDTLIEATSVINGMQVPYRGAIGTEFGGNNPNLAQELINLGTAAVSGEGENCNATAWTILTRAGIAPKKPSGTHPGWGAILGSRTAGKENALPAAEVMGAGTPYKLDKSREVADAQGVIQIYRDRLLTEPMSRMQHGATVTLLDEFVGSRRVLVGGVVGYVPRRTDDYEYDMLGRWITALRANCDDAYIQYILDNRDDANVIDQASEDTGIPGDNVVRAAALALDANGEIAGLLALRLGMLGDDRVRELVDNPDEAARLAATTGVDAATVAAEAAALVREVEFPQEVSVCLLKHLNDPNAANIAANEHPDYPTLKAIAIELNADPVKVRDAVNKLRPATNQGQYFAELLDADPLAQGELPNIADYMLKGWATATGVSVDFLKLRCQAVHQANEAAKAEAARLALQAAAAADAKKARAAARKKRKQAKGEGRQKPAAEKSVHQFMMAGTIKMGADMDVRLDLRRELGATAKAADLTHEVAEQIAKRYEDMGVTVGFVFAVAQERLT